VKAFNTKKTTKEQLEKAFVLLQKQLE